MSDDLVILARDICKRLRMRQPLLGKLCDEAADGIERLVVALVTCRDLREDAVIPITEHDREMAKVLAEQNLLRAEIGRLTMQVDALNRALCKSGDEREQLRTDCGLLKNVCEAQRVEVERLLDRVKWLQSVADITKVHPRDLEKYR